MHQTISFSKTRLNARFRSVATRLRKKQNKTKQKLVIQTIPDLFINRCPMYRHYQSHCCHLVRRGVITSRNSEDNNQPITAVQS